MHERERVLQRLMFEFGVLWVKSAKMAGMGSWSVCADAPADLVVRSYRRVVVSVGSRTS